MPVLRLVLHPENYIMVNLCPLLYLSLLGKIKDLERAICNSIEVRHLETDFLYRCKATMSLLHQGFGCKHILMKKSNLKHSSCYLKEALYYDFGTLSFDNAPIHQCRFHTINELLIFMLKYVYSDPSERLSLAKCFKLLWRILPFSYIRVQEIQNLFQLENNKELCSFNCLETLKHCCQVYVKDFPFMSVGEIMPRSLEHSCRCKIRKILMRNKRWPDGINELQLPAVLEAYVKLRC
nr:uncharacterized protein LOC107439774 [Parasteatoda tepidariorum]